MLRLFWLHSWDMICYDRVGCDWINCYVCCIGSNNLYTNLCLVVAHNIGWIVTFIKKPLTNFEAHVRYAILVFGMKM